MKVSIEMRRRFGVLCVTQPDGGFSFVKHFGEEVESAGKTEQPGVIFTSWSSVQLCLYQLLTFTLLVLNPLTRL